MKTFHKGGIHPPAGKTTADIPSKDYVPENRELRILTSQSIGKPSKPIVKKDQHVEAGEKIADADGFVSVPLHSPVSGTVKKIDKVRDSLGLWKEAIFIEADDFTPPAPNPRSQEEIDALSAKEIVQLVAANGIVGLGGATFPTHVKLSPPEGMTPEVVLINGAECEPVLTCDDRLMRERPKDILKGTQLIMRAVNVNRAIVGIEENKPEAIKAMREAAQDMPGIEIEVLKKKYPQGGEKQLIAALMGREVPEGALPVAVGAIVDNVATAYAVYDAIYNRRPLTHRIVTVAGDTPYQGNWWMPLGVSISDFIDTEALSDKYKLIAGGPMMGRAVSHPEAPNSKGFSGLIVKTKDTERKSAKPCIRCARCVSACPMGLEPFLLMSLSQNLMWEAMSQRHAMSCIECGSCSYVCPSDRPLLDFIRLGKNKIRNLK